MTAALRATASIVSLAAGLVGDHGDNAFPSASVSRCGYHQVVVQRVDGV